MNLLIKPRIRRPFWLKTFAVSIASFIYGEAFLFTAEGNQAEIRVEVNEGTTSSGIEFKSKRTFRGDELILYEAWRNGARSRNYYLHGKLIWGEADDTGDGVMESLLIFSADGGIAEAFNRDPDGNVAPVPTERLEEMRKKLQEARERMEAAIGISNKPEAGNGVEAPGQSETR
jgi:hypothetical protein